MKPIWHRVFFWSALGSAAVSVAFAAGPVFWHYRGDPGTIVPEQAPAASVVARSTDVDVIIALAPFGSAEPPAAAPDAPAVETSLGLTLVGVTVSTPAASSRAIISDQAGMPSTYSIGQNVTENATLAEVYEGYVILRVNGSEEKLSFPSLDAVQVTGSGDFSALLAAQGAAAPVVAMPQDPDAVIASYRSAIDADPQSVLDQIGLEKTDNGYRIAERHDSGVDRAGLRTGDVVTTVNGQQVGDLEADRKLFDEVAASGRARIEVLRDEKKIIMTFPLR